MTLVIENLSFNFGRMTVLQSINTQASRGKITAVVGPNAAGKSTLLRCIIGVLKPATGHVLIDGQIVHHASPRILAQRIAYVPQRATVSAAFTVRQVVELGRYAFPASAARVDDALEKMEMIELADRPYAALSVGQQQRVTLARALAQLSPDGHLVLDEPASAMDLRHEAQCMKLLRQTADAGATVLLAMHDLSLAALIADEIWLLDSGRLVGCGGVREVLEPARLKSVFGVGFSWIALPGCGTRLVSDATAGTS